MSTHSNKHISDGDNYLKNQSDEDSNVAQAEKEAETLSTAKFSECPQKRVAPTNRTAVAFHVTLSKRTTVTNNDVIVYDFETLDQGDGYNPRDGLYIAPESATYVLTWTTICNPHNYFKTLLVVNGAIRGTSWTDSQEINDYHQTTAVIVLTLNQGDHIFIRMGPTNGHGTIVSDNIVGYSSFSGWKLD
ncbi:EMILIN-2-like [Pecten maximus]|uniref:EMILIN-2-like n=1 Tax=Pecten maximus TaxID=6579 RepID=UPI0014580575|nr:EMILIN-2-like [Pecten maximus]